MNPHRISGPWRLLGALALLAGCDPAPAEGHVVPLGPELGEDAEPEPDPDEPEPGPMEPDDEPAPADHSDALDAYVFSLGHLEIEPAAAEHEIACDPATMDCPEPWEQDGLTCQMRHYEVTEHHDRLLALQPDDPMLWPGALVRGGEVADGFLSSVGLERAPATFSISLENLVSSPAATMQSPSRSEFRAARNDLLSAGVDGPTAAQMSYEIHSVASRSELSIMIGASVDWASVIDFDGMFGFDDDEYTNRYLFDFTQTYYTIDLDTPARPSSVFAAGVTVEDLASYTGEGDPPMIVQSVGFGRRVLFAIESNDSLSQIVAAVDAAFGGVAELDADVEAVDTLTSAKITAAIIGGDGGAAVRSVLGPEHLIEFITEGGDYSAESPGSPISYRLAYLDGATARLALTARYAAPQCQ